MDDKNTWYWIGGLLAVVLIIAAVEKARKNRLKEQTRETLTQYIDTGTGGVGNNTVANATNNVGQDANYNPASDAKTIYDAACWDFYGGWLWGNVYCGGGERAVSVLSRLNRSQLATLDNFFRSQYGSNLDNFFRTKYAQSEQPAIFAAIAKIR